MKSAYSPIKLNKIFFLTVLLFIFTYTINAFYSNQLITTLNNKLIQWGDGWENHRSHYSGSEFGFIIKNADTLSIEITVNTKAQQGIETEIDGKKVSGVSSENNTGFITYSLNENTIHTVSIRHYCTYLYDPCDISINKILIRRRAKLLPFELNKPVLSILGDSISTIYGSQNYIWLVSKSLGYQLHNASRMGSTVSNIPEYDSALHRYEIDLRQYKSAKTAIFLGTNDAKNHVPYSTFKNDYSTIVGTISNWNQTGQLYLVGILPRKDIDPYTILEYNNIIQNTASKYNVQYVETTDWITLTDLADDVHPSIESQKIISQKFEKILKQD